MSDSNSNNDHHGFNNSPSVQITGKIMVIAIIILFLVVVFVLFLHLYAKWFWWRIEHPPSPPANRGRRRRRFVFAPGQEDSSFPSRTGLDLAILRSIPVLVFSPEDKELECAVCLSDVEQGEKARLLPKCNHGFHVECIDMWFQSHSTCPICRNAVGRESVAPVGEIELQTSSSQDSNLVSGHSTDFPTNVLFWGNETQVSNGCLEERPSTSTSTSTYSQSPSSTSLSEMLVIDIPVSMSESSTTVPEDESKSPMPTRMRSLKRLLSREKRVNPSTSTSSSSCDA